MNTIAPLLSLEDIRLDVAAAGKTELFDEIGIHMERVHDLPRRWVALGLSRREQVGTTGLGKGVAIPHARVAELDRIVAAYLRLRSPIPFDAVDREPVSDVLVLLVPAPASDEHLRILADATGMFRDADFRVRLRQCGKPDEVKQLFEGWPERSAE
jgi:nitrogen PTS system EIIA component